MKNEKDSEKLLQLEKYFKKSIKLALQDMVPWSTLANLLNDMAQSPADCQLLIKILLKELEIMHKQKQVDKVSETIEKEETPNDIQGNQDSDEEMQDDRTLDDHDENQIIEEFSEVESVECLQTYHKKENEEMQFPEAYDLKDFYTFVGNNEVKVNDKRSETSYPKVIEYQIKSKDQLSIYDKKDQEFDVRDEKPKNTLDKGRQKELECSVCLKSFSGKGSLKIHEKIHSGERHHECKTCKKRFAHFHTLKNHERLHTGEKPFECIDCAKSFTTSSHLLYHERTHTGEKPFECKYCKKGFIQSTTLKTHEMIHTGEKPFQCKYCKECFSQYPNLKSHERIHTGEVPFGCMDCGKRFKSSSNLKTHKSIHSNEKPYECKLCEKRYKLSSHLIRHKKKAHKKLE